MLKMAGVMMAPPAGLKSSSKGEFETNFNYSFHLTASLVIYTEKIAHYLIILQIRKGSRWGTAAAVPHPENSCG